MLDPATKTPPTTPLLGPRCRPSEPLVPGDRYQLGEPIARGGMGEVITAHDAPIGRDVAIKRLRGSNPSPLSLARFLREARIQGRLDHPAIVPVHEVGVDEAGRPFFAMKKLSGTTLSQILAAEWTRFTRQQLLRAFADICLAIEFAHTRGVIHRDIKPANILLGDFGEVYMLDWGIARVPTDRPPETYDTGDPVHADASSGVATIPGSALGTPGYMAPEQARGEEVDDRADVYSLGCVLFEILAGVPLHPRTNAAAMRSTLKGVDARPSLHAPDVPPELDLLCVRATALDPAERIATARELAERVHRFLDGDRDVALRGRLAREHLELAKTAPDDDDGRRVAMREAGQALALEPTLAPAAELIGRLMLEPPKTIPAEVRSELAQTDRTTSRGYVMNAINTYIFTLALVPIMWFFGAHDVFYLSAFAGLAVLGLVGAVIDLRLDRDIPWFHCAIAVASLVVIARGFTPFLIAPAAVAVNVVAFAFHPRGDDRRQFALFVALGMVAILGVWVCELVGVTSRTMVFAGGTIMLSSPIEGADAIPLEWVLASFVTLGTVNASVLAFRSARVSRLVRERATLQAWKVRQLSPLDQKRAGTGSE